ncbi:MAG TPA: glycoside hydrolase domain-containing protein [Kofleriaceae bacterium]|nr:glycoside hydrolase domain-containing protein [Kofleriaceae bacterium]
MALGLSACADLDEPVDPETLGDVASDATVRSGVDYSWARPSPSGIRSAGYTFAVRYFSFDTTGKNLTASEARGLQAAGVDLVSNWENGASDALKGRARGASDATEALRQATAAGMPAGRPIYFSVDFDAQPSQQAALNDYFDGAASVLGVARTGAYGGIGPIGRLFDAGKIGFGWQTFAWSAGRWEPRAQLRQVKNGVTVAGGDCDVDQSQTDDFGQWGAVTIPVADVEKLVAARNTDGTLEAFWITTGNAIQHARQTAAGWTADTALGGLAKKLAIGTNADGRLEVFYAGTNDMLFHRVQLPTGGWSGEIAFGVAATELAVGRNADGRLEVVFTSPGGALQHAWQTAPNGSWSAAAALGGAAKDVEIGANADGRLEVFYIGTNNLLYHRVQLTAGGWSSEIAFGVAASDLAVARNSDGRLELFFAGPTAAINHVWQTAANGSWTGASALGGSAKKLVGGANADGRLEVFYVGTNDQLFHRVQLPTGNWSDELSFGFSGRELAVAANTDGRLELFFAATSGALSHTWQTAPNSTWTGSALLSGSVAP